MLTTPHLGTVDADDKVLAAERHELSKVLSSEAGVGNIEQEQRQLFAIKPQDHQTRT